MKYSEQFSKTNKNAKGFDSVNATYLIKAGFIDQLMAGVYSYLPFGLRVLSKIEAIVREEMDRLGSEVLLPSLSPLELWEKTKRLSTVDVLFKVEGANAASKARNEASYVLNSTHEELVTPLGMKFRKSYKELPFAMYQIQTKFRNEARPKSGILRGREFRMKDLYSFHTDEADLLQYYDRAKNAYLTVFSRLGLEEFTYVALASGGDFTKDYSHEFQVRCETGEDLLFRDPGTHITYNREVAPSEAPVFYQNGETQAEKTEVHGPGIVGVEKLADYLQIPVEKTTKTILFEADGGMIIAAAVRGDYDVNELKLKKVTGVTQLKLATAEIVKKVTGAEVGYAGILGLPSEVKVILDDSLKGRVNFECGANKTDYHTINVNFGRDLSEPERFYDIKLAKEGDIAPESGKPFEVFNGAEIGNIFPLNTKFSEAFDYKYIDQSGKEQPVYMGCYGIGTTRLMGVIVEKFHDEKGIIWPKQLAPFLVHLIHVGDDPELIDRASGLYRTLTEAGIEVLWDDRSVSPGVKFADADLIGNPVRLVLSQRNGEQIEWKGRTETEGTLLTEAEVVQKLQDMAEDKL